MFLVAFYVFYFYREGEREKKNNFWNKIYKCIKARGCQKYFCSSSILIIKFMMNTKRKGYIGIFTICETSRIHVSKYVS